MNGYEVCWRIRSNSQTDRLPVVMVTAQVIEDKQIVASLKNDVQLFSRLYIACQTQEVSLDLFNYENQP